MHIVNNSKKIEETIQQSLQKSKFNQNVQVIVVSKQQSLENIIQLYDLGYRHFAENRVDKLLERKRQLKEYDDITWHLIGTLQTRKVKQIVSEVDYIHSIDSLKLIEEIEKRAVNQKNIFLQVNIFNEEQKHGFKFEEIENIISQMHKYNKIKVVGLMCIAPFGSSKDVLNYHFSQIKLMQDKIQQRNIVNAPCTFLSMGMSQDYEIAIELGATHVRIGSAFFEKGE